MSMSESELTHRSNIILANQLGISNQLELTKAEEKTSKQKAKKLFESKSQSIF